MNYSDAATWIRGRLWIAVAAGCVPWLVWLGGLIHTGGKQDLSGNLVGVDHLAFYHAARLIRDGDSYRIYNYNELADERYQQALIGWDWNGFEAYRNPPFYALLYVPTAGLSFYASLAIWSVVSFALLALAIYLLKPERLGRAFLWSMTFFPVFATISFGQNTFISLAIFAGVYRLLSNERRFAAGLVAGLLWFKPQLLLGLFIWWAFQPRRYSRCWLGVIVTGGVLAAVSGFAIPDASDAFVKTLRANAGWAEFGPWNVMNPKAFFALLLPGLSEAYWLLAVGCSFAGISIAWHVKQKTGAPVAVMFPVAVFLSLWASPHALVYEWALVIAVGVVLWEKLPDSRDVWLCLFALAWVGLAISTALAKSQMAAKWPAVIQIGVPVLGLVGWLAAKELARSSEAQPRQPDAQPVMPP
jgi:alpha-1,2-mannosyltransferase